MQQLSVSRAGSPLHTASAYLRRNRLVAAKKGASDALLIPSPLGVQGAALATLASYLIVFLVRAHNARRLIPFRLFKKNLLLSTAVLTVLILIMRFAWPGWQAMQLGVVVILQLVGRKQIIERIAAFRQRKRGT